jgi:hypothetical protein
MFDVPRAARPMNAMILKAQFLSAEMATAISSVKDLLPDQWIKRHMFLPAILRALELSVKK